jgi:hypothetical protein
MKAYLSGAIEDAPDSGGRWREEMSLWLKGTLQHDVFNPVEKEKTLLTEEELKNFRLWKTDDYDRFKKVVQKIIREDLDSLVNQTDYVICLWDEHVLAGGGTHGEVTLSYHLGIPVYTVLGMPRRKVSSWILGCCTQEFESFDDLRGFLEERYGG